MACSGLGLCTWINLRQSPTDMLTEQPNEGSPSLSIYFLAILHSNKLAGKAVHHITTPPPPSPALYIYKFVDYTVQV